MRKLLNIFFNYSIPEIICIIGILVGITYIIKTPSSNRQSGYELDGHWVRLVDGHEYLGTRYTHKENCTNLIHKTIK